MKKVTINLTIELDLHEASDEQIKTAGREIIGSIAVALDDNTNMVDDGIRVIKADTEVVRVVNCLPDLEINQLHQ